MNYSNIVIAKELGVSAKLIHKHRKKFNPVVDRAIRNKFFTKFTKFTKFPKLPYDREKTKIENVSEHTFIEKLKIFLRKIFYPIYLSYRKIFA
jgi:hypothetical protein